MKGTNRVNYGGLFRIPEPHLCEWPGCKEVARTTGLTGKRRFGNVCDKHKAMGDRKHNGAKP